MNENCVSFVSHFRETKQASKKSYPHPGDFSTITLKPGQ